LLSTSGGRGRSEKKKALEPHLGKAEALKEALCIDVDRLLRLGRYQGVDREAAAAVQPPVRCRLGKRELTLTRPTLSAIRWEACLRPLAADTVALLTGAGEPHDLLRAGTPVPYPLRFEGSPYQGPEPLRGLQEKLPGTVEALREGRLLVVCEGLVGLFRNLSGCREPEQKAHGVEDGSAEWVPAEFLACERGWGIISPGGGPFTFAFYRSEGDAVKEIRFGEIEGIEVGHAEDLEGGTGCTVVLCPKGAAAGVDVRGGAPGTRETDLLDPSNLVERIHAVFLAGGSAFGLDAGSGVMRFFEERGIGFDVGVARVPIVCGAVLFDLAFGSPRARPDAEMGYRACRSAKRGGDSMGNVGAGTGATVGKILGMERAMKGGLGGFALQAGGLRVGALVAVNALGNILDPAAGAMLAGPLSEDRGSILDTEALLVGAWDRKKDLFGGNTSIGVVATNADLTKAQARKVASMAHDGFARTMRPAHSLVDGDTLFAMATGAVAADVNAVGLLAARAVERAVVAAVTRAGFLCGVPSRSDLDLG